MGCGDINVVALLPSEQKSTVKWARKTIHEEGFFLQWSWLIHLLLEPKLLNIKDGLFTILNQSSQERKLQKIEKQIKLVSFFSQMDDQQLQVCCVQLLLMKVLNLTVRS